jgi:hypothetical protein
MGIFGDPYRQAWKMWGNLGTRFLDAKSSFGPERLSLVKMESSEK